MSSKVNYFIVNNLHPTTFSTHLAVYSMEPVKFNVARDLLVTNSVFFFGVVKKAPSNNKNWLMHDAHVPEISYHFLVNTV